MMMSRFSRKTVKRGRKSEIKASIINSVYVDDLLGQLIHAVEGKVENDYVVIYTSSYAKVRKDRKKAIRN